MPDISPHITAMVPFMEELHINERAALCRSIRWDGKYALLLSKWQAIYAEVVKTFGDKDLRTSRAALELADAYGQNGNIPKMEEMERALVVSRSEIYGPDSLETMDALLNLSRTLVYYKNEYKEAEEAALKTLETRKRILGTQHLDVYESLYTLGSIRRLSKQYTEAVSTFLEAVDLSTSLVGREHSQTYDALRMLAMCYEAQKNPDAQTIMQELYDTRESVLGPKHPDTLSSLHLLGESCYNMGDHAQAEELFRRELRIRRESDGPQSATTISAIHWLGCSLYHQGIYPEARELFREEVAGRTLRGLDMNNAKFWLAATIFLEQEDSQEAEDLFREYTERAKERHTTPHVNTSDGLYWTGRSLLARGKYAEAAKALEECLSVGLKLKEETGNASHAKLLLALARQRLEKSKEKTP